MANFIETVFFFYIFIGLYMVSLLFLIYLPNRKKLFSHPKGKPEPVSIIMPCYNEEKGIGKAIEALLNLNYPKNMIELIIVDDKSTDNSVNIAKEYVKKHEDIKLIVNKKNSGGAAEPINIGIKAAKYDYIVVADSDSAPDKNALIKMIGFLQKDGRVGGVTCAILAKKPETFMQKLQEIEYMMISWSRKMLDLVDSVYVTPGPFALYRKNTLLKIGLFDTENMTQDIEIVWRILSYGYKVKMCLDAKVYSETPRKFRHWWRQRIRWNIGGTQTLIKYRKKVFKNGMLGAFIIPFFSASLFIGLFGLGLFIYLLFRRFFVAYLSAQHSIYASATIIRFQELTFAPSILNYFGASLFILGMFFTLLGLYIMKETRHEGKTKFFNIIFYLIVYLSVYPLIMVAALYKLARGKYSW